VAVHSVEDVDRKTGVLPIFECPTDLCDQFSENLKAMMRNLLDDDFYFYFLKCESERIKMTCESFRALILC
jgi:hypothetical protein